MTQLVVVRQSQGTRLVEEKLIKYEYDANGEGEARDRPDATVSFSHVSVAYLPHRHLEVRKGREGTKHKTFFTQRRVITLTKHDVTCKGYVMLIGTNLCVCVEQKL